MKQSEAPAALVAAVATVVIVALLGIAAVIILAVSNGDNSGALAQGAIPHATVTVISHAP